ncbi:hypothetical protein [Streptomyces europaeiscabiei]|nr:hypothetical protein [Streptomyces europaeiscabiei]
MWSARLHNPPSAAARVIDIQATINRESFALKLTEALGSDDELGQ